MKKSASSEIRLFTITEVNTTRQFLELEHEWNKVLDRSRDKNIFLTWQYLSTYWKHFGRDKKLRVLFVEDKNEVIAIAPLRQSRYGFMNSLGYDVIEPLGYRGLTPEGADYTGLLLGKNEAECLQLFLNHLVERDDWDFIHMDDIPGTSILHDLLPKSSGVIPGFEMEQGAKCPYMPIPNSMDILMNGLSANLRRNLRRRLRKLEKDYHRVELKNYDEFTSIEEAMKIFFELHQKRWKSQRMPGVFKTKEVRDFYIDVVKLFADNGWLALYFLTANDEPVASQYCLEYDRKMYFCLPGFDPDYSKYGVGNLILAKIIEKCVEKGIEEYDFLKGDESYKFDWTSTYRRNWGIRFVNRKFTSSLYRVGIQMVKQIKMDRLLGRILDQKK